MAISTEIVGKTFGPFVRDYTFKDLEICALGCGAGWDGKVDLDYVNEGDAKNPELKVLPIFAVPLTVNEEMTTTLDYGFDYSGSLHYGIDVHFHAPFKMSDHIETYVTQEAIWDRGEGRAAPRWRAVEGKLCTPSGHLLILHHAAIAVEATQRILFAPLEESLCLLGKGLGERGVAVLARDEL